MTSMNRGMLDVIFEDYMEMKRVAVKEADGEIPMMLFAAPDPLDAEQDTSIAAIIVPDGHFDFVNRALAKMLAELFAPYWIACCSDAYIAKHGYYPDDIMKGDLQKAFEAGDEHVKEGLTMTAVDHGGDIFTNTVTYWFDSDGDIWYDDVRPASIEEAQQSSGPIVEILKATVEFHGMTQVEILGKLTPRN